MMFARSIRPWLLTIAAFLLLAPMASAGERESPNLNYARNGPYFGLGFVGGVYTQADRETEKELAAIGYVIDVDSSVAAGFYTTYGYRLNPHAAAQLHFQYLPDTDVEFDGVKLLEVNTWTLTGDIKGYLPMGPFQPYVLAGLGIMHTKQKSTLGIGSKASTEEFVVRLGGGIDYYLTENYVFEVELGGVLPSGDLKGLDLFTFAVGLQYGF